MKKEKVYEPKSPANERERTWRRKRNRILKLTKDQVLEEKFLEELQESYNKCEANQYIKTLQRWDGTDVVFVEFVSPKVEDFWQEDRIIIEINGKKEKVLSHQFKPLVDPENFELWKIEKEISLKAKL